MGVKVNCCTSRADLRLWCHQRYWLVNGEMVAISGNTVHLGYTICTKDREEFTLAAKNNFWKQSNMFIANFGQLYSFIKIKLSSRFYCSFYGIPLWYLNGAAVLPTWQL